MMGPVYWCAFLLLVSLTLFALEIFVPSGGTLGILSAISAIAALVVAFRDGPLLGLGTLATIAVIGPAAFAIAAKLWPHTPFGRRIIQTAPQPDEVLPPHRSLEHLIGKQGRAVSRMLPGGIVEVQGESWDATTVGTVVDEGDNIVVVRTEGRRLVVQKLDSQVALSIDANTDPTGGAENGNDSNNPDYLNELFDEFGDDDAND